MKTSQAELLSPRQQEILELVVKGLSNKEIARALKLGEGTVKIHVSVLFRKLGIRRRAGAAVAAGRFLSIEAKQHSSAPTRPMPRTAYESRLPGLGYTSRFSGRIRPARRTRRPE